ncbi:hypothetical protein VTO42DRAFT_3454 [Malbranchea cinnamomea]
MDRVPDTPLRQGRATTKAGAGSESDETFSGEETVATVPLGAYHPRTTQTQESTQPTQILEQTPRPMNNQSSPFRPPSPIIQVATSSPLTPNNTHNSYSSAPRYAGQRPGILSSAMAPPGTRFRPPPMIKIQAPLSKKLPTDDDGPTYRGGSSDEDDMQLVTGTDIKPSTFTKASRHGQDKERVAESPITGRSGRDAFKEIMASSFYRPSTEKRRADPTTLAGPMSKKSRSESPADRTAFLNTIEDYSAREKVRRMLGVFPAKSPKTCYDVLIAKRGNYDEALNYLAEIDDKEVDGSASEDELSLPGKTPKPPPAGQRPPPAKQQVKARNRIQDRWTSSQRVSNNIGKDEDASDEGVSRKPGRRLIRGQKSRQTSPASVSKKPGRLIRGRRNHSLSRSELPVLNVIESDSSSDVDGGIQSEDDYCLEEKVLKFFNECSAEDLADIAEISTELANVLILKRPFPSLTAVRGVTDEKPESNGLGAKKSKRPKKALGDKVVDKCLDMWAGYEAVDALVSKCEALGKPIAEEMKRWGVDVFGCKTQGELELTSLSQANSDQPHDSGIGTPSSNRSTSEEVAPSQKSSSSFIQQPSIMSESIKMKDYQVVGLNWLSLIYKQNLSCILADDMGLGKTCQVIAFLAHLLEQGIEGPHLVVVPSSTLENWLREFSVFCPKLKVMPYYADQASRAQIREEIEGDRENINVIITTYTLARNKTDATFLRSMEFCVCVYDEGHMLKNSKSLLYEKLIRIPARFRLLLTGTPLQNNLQELASLLGFILPSVFKERKEDLENIFSAKAKTVDDTHSSLLSAQRIARAKSMLTPFVLRRKKHQVIDLPAKITRVEYCMMNEAQREIYSQEINAVKQLIADRAAGKKGPSKSANILMKLRQAAIHPLFYRRLYDNTTLSRMAKACLKEEQWAQSDPDLIYTELHEYNDFECHTLCIKNPKSLSKFALKNNEWMNSGKVEKLCELLKRYVENGDRTLIFSQFTMVMDILEHVLETLQIRFFRLDGTTSVEDRQSILDAFHEQVDIPVFMLSTKAGGAGINLACANKVIIFDSSFNPQEDVQAENRAHRVGQTREVEVVRLVTRDTIEEQIYALGQTKLALDQRVAGEDDGLAGGKKREEAGLKAVEEMVFASLNAETETKQG